MRSNPLSNHFGKVFVDGVEQTEASIPKSNAERLLAIVARANALFITVKTTNNADGVLTVYLRNNNDEEYFDESASTVSDTWQIGYVENVLTEIEAGRIASARKKAEALFLWDSLSEKDKELMRCFILNKY